MAQNQTEYNEKYEALVTRYEETDRNRKDVLEQISQQMVKRRKIERFIENVSSLPELFTEFDPAMWTALVDTMTVYSKEKIVFRLTSGREVEI